jgi:hypothetical protein
LGLKFAPTPRAGEEAALIGAWLEIDQKGATECRFNKNQPAPSYNRGASGSQPAYLVNFDAKLFYAMT